MAEEPAEEKKQYYCSECGTEVKDDDAICPNCGADLSEIIDESQPDVFVTLKLLPNAIAAEHIRNLLAAFDIKSEARESQTNENAEVVSVLVATRDLEKANEILENPANKPREMLLSDIFSSTFSIAGKIFKNNAILASALIPAVLLVVIGINLYLSSYKYTAPDNNKVFVFGQVAYDKQLSKEIYLDATAGIYDKILFTYPDEYKNLIKLNDTIWVLADNRAEAGFRGYISRIEEGNKAYIDLCEKGTLLEPGTKYKVEIINPAPKTILSIGSYMVYHKNGQPFVYTMANGRAKSVDITTGKKSNYEIEILSGIKDGDTIITRNFLGGKQLTDGVEVTTKMPKGQMETTDLTLNTILLSLTVLIFLIASVALYYGVTKTAGLVIEKKEFSVNQTVRSIFSASFLRALISAVSSLVVVVGPYITGLLIANISRENDFMKFGGLFLILLAIPWFVHASVKYNFTFVHSVVSGDGAINSLKKSGSLVKSYWGRTFGILILVSLVTNLIVSLLSTPVAFFMSWKLFSHPEAMGEFYSTQILQRTFTVTAALSIIFRCFIDPIFTAVMYYDLRNRKDEFYFIQDVPESSEGKHNASEPAETA